MDIRIYLYLLIIVLGVFFRQLGDTAKNRKYYINIVLLALLLESCLRGLSVGSDTYSYSLLFQEAGRESWSNIFNMIHGRYIQHIDDVDAGYYLFEKIVSVFSKNFQFFLFICGLCFFLPFRKLLFWADFSMDKLILMFVLYVALFNPIAMSGTRKEIALGFSIMCFLTYIDKKYLNAILWLIVGASIHMSMLIILLFPLINLLSARFKKILHGVTFLFIPSIIVFSSSVLLFMAAVVDNEHYQMYAQDPEGGGMTFLLLIELIFMGCFLFFKKSDLEQNNKLNYLYSMLPVATLLVPLITNNGSMIRISQYFHFYVLFLLPMLTEKIVERKLTRVIHVLLIGILIVMSLQNSMLGSNYYFFWNDPLSLAGYDGYY